MKKMVMFAFMGMFLLSFVLPIVEGNNDICKVEAATYSGLVTIDGKLYYYDPSTGKKVTDKLMTIDGYTYYFKPSGIAASGKTYVNEKAYYFDTVTFRQRTGIIEITYPNAKRKHYFLKEGGLLSGWVTVSGNRYYFSSQETGAIMLTGPQKINGKYYHFDTEGRALTGFVTYNGVMFYLDPTTYARVTGLQTIDGDTYYFNVNTGAAHVKKQYIDGLAYYFDPNTYKQKCGFVTIEYDEETVRTHYFLKEGGMASGWVEENGERYYFSSQESGAIMLTGVQNIEGKLRYFDLNTGALCEGIYENNGNKFYFTKDEGVKTGLQTFNGNLYYCNPAQSGAIQYGFRSVGSSLYFFDETTGAAWKNTSINYGGIKFVINGECVVTSITAQTGYEDNVRVKLILEGLKRLGEENVYCGGFTRDASNMAGLAYVTGASYDQAKDIVDGTYGEIITQDKLRMGDLVFWRWDNCGVENCEHWEEIHHVGFYLGNGKVLEAASTDGTVADGGTIQVQSLRSYEGFEIVYFASIVDDEGSEFLDENLKCATVGKTQNVKAVSAGKNKVTLTWNAVNNADGYLIYAQKAGVYGFCGMTTTGTTFTDKKALDSDYNYYWVFAYKNDTTGKMHPGGTEKYVFAKGITCAVTGLRVSSVYGGVTLAWNSVVDAEGYLIYGIVGGNSYRYVGMTTLGTTFKDVNASKTVYNYYWVYPYHRDASGKMVVGGTARYTYGKAR